ncbi:MAG: hypothetical protein JSV86_11070 [Gemmatimonadota bacterium]|nr:MAG: hypothetical protein JSV86_11070 [Gemmatimonadota bacterium]
MNAPVVSKKRRAYAARFGAASLLAVAAALACLSCDEGPSGPPPGPGDLVVSLISPNGDEGASVFETDDEGIVEVAIEGGDVFHLRSAGTSRIVVLLDRPGRVRFTMNVGDRATAPELEIVEVADGENRLRDDLSRYSVRLSW